MIFFWAGVHPPPPHSTPTGAPPHWNPKYAAAHHRHLLLLLSPKANTHSQRVEGWVDLDGRLHTEMAYPLAHGHNWVEEELLWRDLFAVAKFLSCLSSFLIRTSFSVRKHVKQGFCLMLFTQNNLVRCYFSSTANRIAATMLIQASSLRCL